MKNDSAATLEAIFSEALEHEAGARREAFLEAACRGDLRLLRTVKELLEASNVTQRFLPEQPTARAEGVPQIPGFRMVRELGRGGIGVVYEAFDEKLQRNVALKVLAGGASKELIAEARRAASLRDAGIVTIYSVHDEGGLAAISMELVEGFAIDRATVSLNFEQKARVLMQVAQALAVAHRAGVIHRDLKPENVLVSPDLSAKVLDFGLAISAQEGEAARAFFEGTPRYASPEQVGGRPLTTASDVFSFGSLMFKVLTGRAAFDGATAIDVLDTICNSAPPFLKDVAVGVPEDLQAICLACLAWEPGERPSAVEVATDLRRFLEGEPVRLRPSLYGDILRRKISEYSNEVVHWERQGMISADEKDRLEAVHRRILADEDHWIVDARKITMAQTVLYTATWLVVVAGVLAIWLARDELPAALKWAAPLLGTLWLFGAGTFSWRRREPLASAAFLASATLSLAPTVLALLKEGNVLMTHPEKVTQLFPDFTNAQVIAACVLSLGASCVAWWRLKMTGFAWTTGILGAATYVAILLPLNFLEKKPEVQALWLLPLAALEIAGLACEKKGQVRWSLPFDLISLAALVGCLDVMAAQGPTLEMMGFNAQKSAFWDSQRLNCFSIALNGTLFLLLTLLTERARSLDLRRTARLLEPLALLHLLGPLFANAAANHPMELPRIDAGIYLAMTAILLALGTWRGSWRMLVGALGGLAFGSYLVLHLKLAQSGPFTLSLAAAGILVSALMGVRLLRANASSGRR